MRPIPASLRGGQMPQVPGSSQVMAGPVFNLKLRQVPAFPLPGWPRWATEVPDSDLGLRIYHEQAATSDVAIRFASAG